MTQPDDTSRHNARGDSDERLVAKLQHQIIECALRIFRGKAAAHNYSVRAQAVLVVASIVLSSLGTAGLLKQRVAAERSDRVEPPSFGALVLLCSGIATQIANQFQIGRRATDSEALAMRCGVIEMRLTNVLPDEDPQKAVADILLELMKLFETHQYFVVLPLQTREMDDRATAWALGQVAKHRAMWKLRVIRPSRGGPRARRK